ncbi:hypothetical protein BpHYR1_009520 [Brachionus plicatilis]|uniref:Uncharacterized protein n=1 Tax=Brachionus plicatilis TaxID=10195 RepID=A0A3M7SU38_BRAPC|nr:hypothetical protein BpHYR1_009520 [Brachionus plicatilis]
MSSTHPQSLEQPLQLITGDNIKSRRNLKVFIYALSFFNKSISSNIIESFGCRGQTVMYEILYFFSINMKYFIYTKREFKI